MIFTIINWHYLIIALWWYIIICLALIKILLYIHICMYIPIFYIIINNIILSIVWLSAIRWCGNSKDLSKFLKVNYIICIQWIQNVYQIMQEIFGDEIFPGSEIKTANSFCPHGPLMDPMDSLSSYIVWRTYYTKILTFC